MEKEGVGTTGCCWKPPGSGFLAVVCPGHCMGVHKGNCGVHSMVYTGHWSIHGVGYSTRVVRVYTGVLRCTQCGIPESLGCTQCVLQGFTVVFPGQCTVLGFKPL